MKRKREPAEWCNARELGCSCSQDPDEFAWAGKHARAALGFEACWIQQAMKSQGPEALRLASAVVQGMLNAVKPDPPRPAVFGELDELQAAARRMAAGKRKDVDEDWEDILHELYLEDIRRWTKRVRRRTVEELRRCFHYLKKEHSLLKNLVVRSGTPARSDLLIAAEIWEPPNAYSKYNQRLSFMFSLRPGSKVLDLGANAGAFLLWAYQEMDHEGQIVCYEPSIPTATLLKIHARAIDGGSFRADVRPRAITPDGHGFELHDHTFSSAGSSSWANYK